MAAAARQDFHPRRAWLARLGDRLSSTWGVLVIVAGIIGAGVAASAWASQLARRADVSAAIREHGEHSHAETARRLDLTESRIDVLEREQSVLIERLDWISKTLFSTARTVGAPATPPPERTP